MTDHDERVSALFDDWARRGRAEGMERGHEPAARQAFEWLAVRPGQGYLDVGCGNGYSVRWAAAVDPSVRAVGVDVSAEMIALARAASAAFPNATYHCAAFPGASLPAGELDAIFSMEVFYYLPDLGAGLREIARVLAPGGRFACVVDFYAENEASHDWPEQVGVPMHLLSEAGWRDAMEQAGLRVVEQARLRPPLEPGAEPSWKHREGSLLTLAARP
jgi:SAM-dependent methyltransferase